MKQKIECRNCAAWDGNETTAQGSCQLHPPQAVMANRMNSLGQPEPIVMSFWPLTAPNVGCFDGIPKESHILNG